MGLLLKRYVLSCLCLIAMTAWGQDKKAYTLAVTSFAQGESNALLVLESENLKFNFSVTGDPFNTMELPGRLVVLASRDSLPGADDQMLLDSLCTIPQYSYGERPIHHQLQAGAYYVISTFYAKDQNAFQAQSNSVAVPVRVVGFKTRVTSAWFSYLKTSAYSEETALHLELEMELGCCAQALGNFNSQWEIGVAERKNSKPKVIHTFYREDALKEGVYRITLDESLWNEVTFSKYKYITVRLTSAYFAEGYRQVPDWEVQLPISVITDINQLNAERRKQYPFLTYGSYLLSEAEMLKVPVDQLYEDAKVFYKQVHSVLTAVQQRDLRVALQYADSAFAFAGSNKAAALLFIEPGIVSSLYSGIFKWGETHPMFTEEDRKGVNFRLGEAMKMEDLIKTGYDTLVAKILPDSLWLLDDMEQSGFYGNKIAFSNDNLTSLPVVWKEHTVPALKHFIRVADYESADLIISAANEHINLVLPLWETLTSDTIFKSSFRHLANTLSESNGMQDFEIAKLKYYVETGLFIEGEHAVRDAALAYVCGYQFAPLSFWKEVGLFYESQGAYSKADSLYVLCDAYVQSEMDKFKGKSLAQLKLKGRNQDLLQAKLQVPVKKDNSVAKLLEEIRTDDNALLAYWELLSSRELAQKLGFLGSEIYDNFYWNQIKQLKTQQEYFLANDWMKELAFLLGRDDRLEQSLFLYQELFVIENLRALAFRLGFSEQAQLYYSQKQQETFSRFLNVFNAYRENGDPEIINKLMETCLHQALFQHAYILRGNYNLLYDINRSTDPQVERLAIEWQVLREYLNELYIKEEPDKAGMVLVKNRIIEVEKKLVRQARDTESMRYDYIPPTDSLRKQLKAEEAGVEIIRYQENHKSYYGKKIKYAALIVKQSGPIEVVVFPEEGESMEGRHFKRYRNSIQFKLKDENSFKVYWQPLADALQGIKKVYYAPDGIFHLINPNTLFNSESNKYLLDEVAIRMVPTIAEIHTEQPVAIATATLLGNPVYGEGQVLTQGDTLRTSREFFSRQPIAALPGTKTEVETISKLFDQYNANTTLLTGTRASKQKLFENNNVDVMHIATHGFWIDKPVSQSGYYNLFETMSSSGLVLAGAQKKLANGGFSLAPQGILTSAEIQDMNLFGSRLVVLSACETGLGEVVPGEGLFGLKRALQKAGVQSLITSLWKVDDEATMQFMTLFYGQLMKSQSLSGSFHEAMTSLKEKYPEPYYWGAFVLTNNR
ncbi:MAG TPA: hypothetical protein DIS90_08355 [Cytophagales bacterium]|nr:hypothetical protein [Cytophagales bacterium]